MSRGALIACSNVCFGSKPDISNIAEGGATYGSRRRHSERPRWARSRRWRTTKPTVVLLQSESQGLQMAEHFPHAAQPAPLHQFDH